MNTVESFETKIFLNKTFKKILIITHGLCTDGYVALWAVTNWALDNNIDFIEYHAKYQQEFPFDLLKDVDGVVIVDFSYSASVLREVHQRIGDNNIIVLDHHKTAKADLEGLKYCIFDMERSGCGLAWDYFYPNVKRPWLVDYAEDYDLWRHQLPSSKEINAFIRAQVHDLDVFDTISEMPINIVENIGKHILGYHNKVVDQIVESARPCKLVAWKDSDFHSLEEVPLANCPGIFASDVGDKLDKNQPYSITWHETKDGGHKYSLCSDKDGANTDVSTIAKLFDGGGHRNAAGFYSKDKVHIEAKK